MTKAEKILPEECRINPIYIYNYGMVTLMVDAISVLLIIQHVWREVTSVFALLWKDHNVEPN